jgi:8-oxo-dGTP pyrophosphatase MutT (NUDIX family)
MLQTIYFNDKPLILATDLAEIPPHEGPGTAVQVLPDNFEVQIQAAIEELDEEVTTWGALVYENVEELLNHLKAYFTLIQAAGGFVYNEDQEVLLIFRRGKWDLPKGKLDEGEDLAACALREVQEETGLQGLDLKSPLCVTYHTYHERGLFVLKESHWFLASARKDQPLSPQLDEDILECKWVSIANLSPYLTQAHASIVDVLKAGITASR